MKSHRPITCVSRLTVISLGLQFASGQLILPWEKEASPKQPPVEPSVKPRPDPITEPLQPSVEGKESAAASTPVEAVYQAWADQLFANTNGKIRIGSPQTTAKKVSVSITLSGEHTTMVFIEKSNDGRKARVIAGPKDSEGDYFAAEKKTGGWVLSSWPDGFRDSGSEPEPVPETDSETALTWDDLSSRRLEREDLLGLDRAELRLLRNEIYARHGQIFKDEELRAHFTRQSWYRPRFQEVDESKFSAFLRHNVALIRATEKE